MSGLPRLTARLVFALAALLCLAAHGAEEPLRVVSWNVSGDTFVTRQSNFNAMMTHMQPDILLLDEVLPTTDVEQLRAALAGIDPADPRPWNVSFGASGGRQRNVIASRLPVEPLSAFNGIIPYPEKPRKRIGNQMNDQEHSYNFYSMAGGIPVNGVTVVDGDRRIMLVSVDLQCCGGGPNDWQEQRRQAEVREIRRLVNLALSKRDVDGLVITGDLNSVGTPYPVLLLLGHYRSPHHGLLAVEIFHLDGASTWTWDGRGTQFPSGVLDYQLYGPNGLEVAAAYIFDTEDLDAITLGNLGLTSGSSSQMGRHRPLVVDYLWRDR